MSSTVKPTFTPALRPPPGVTSNPEHPRSLAHFAILTMGVCVPLITIFFLLRVYVRLWIKRTWIFEDWLVTMSWAGNVAFCGIMRATMSNHGGQHGWDITADQAHAAAYWFSVGAIEYGFMICVTKLAILWLYRRVFSTRRGTVFDKTIITFIVVLVIFYGTTSFLKIFQCSPRERIWNKTVPGRCVDLYNILNISGAFNMVTDFLILLLPVKAVWNLQMDRKKKILVVLVFTFGLCAPVFATVGLIVRLRNSGNPDTTWRQPEILLWAAAELTSGTLCVCFAELGVLRKGFFFRREQTPRRTPSGQVQPWYGQESPGLKKKFDMWGSKSLMSTITASKADPADNTWVELEDREKMLRRPANSFTGVTPPDSIHTANRI